MTDASDASDASGASGAPGGPGGTASWGSPPALPRPGPVTAAAVLTLSLSTLMLVLFVAVGIGIVVSRELFVGDPDTGLAGSTSMTADQLALVGGIFAGVFALWCLAADVMAVGVLRGSQLARVLLTVSASMTALVSLLAVSSVVSLIPLGVAMGVVVMLWTGEAGAWFASHGRRRLLPDSTRPFAD